MEKNWYDRNYKKLLIITVVLLLFSVVYIVHFNKKNGDFIYKDISLTGGTSITVYEPINIANLKANLSSSLPGLTTREIYDLSTGEQKAVISETSANETFAQNDLENYLGYSLVQGKNSDFEFTGASLSKSFYKQLIIAIIIAFLFMAIVVFLLFRTFVPSGAVVLSAFADILMTLVAADMLGIKMSTAGIVAFLMLIGYSVDTDILLTNRLLKRSDGTVNSRILSSLKTGLTMTYTSFFTFLIILLITKSFSVVLSQIFTILVIGLIFDTFNTWITNVSLLKWYAEKKKK